MFFKYILMTDKNLAYAYVHAFHKFNAPNMDVRLLLIQIRQKFFLFSSQERGSGRQVEDPTDPNANNLNYPYYHYGMMHHPYPMFPQYQPVTGTQQVSETDEIPPPDDISESNLSEDEEEDEPQVIWYRCPPNSSFEEESNCLVLKDSDGKDSAIYPESVLEFKMVGSIRLFRVKRFISSVGTLLSSAKVFSQGPPVAPHTLSTQEALAHLVETPLIKALDVWAIPKKGSVQGSLSKTLIDSLNSPVSDAKLSVSNIAVPLDNQFVLSSADQESSRILSSIQADKLKPDASDIEGPLAGKLPKVNQDLAVRDKFLRKLLGTHVKGFSILDLAIEALDSNTLENIETVDDAKLHCLAVQQGLKAARQLLDVQNVSLSKEWTSVRRQIRSETTNGVHPEELRSSMREADLWTENLWSEDQKIEFRDSSRKFASLGTFKFIPGIAKGNKRPASAGDFKSPPSKSVRFVHPRSSPGNRRGRGRSPSSAGRQSYRGHPHQSVSVPAYYPGYTAPQAFPGYPAYQVPPALAPFPGAPNPHGLPAPNMTAPFQPTQASQQDWYSQPSTSSRGGSKSRQFQSPKRGSGRKGNARGSLQQAPFRGGLPKRLPREQQPPHF